MRGQVGSLNNMSPRKATILVDANQYLLLYETVSGRKLIATLLEQKEQIFVTQQIVDEVERRKLSVTAKFLEGRFQEFSLPNIGVPDHLFVAAAEDISKTRAELTDLCKKVKLMQRKLKGFVAQTLAKVSRSEDEVSVALKPLFDGAHTPKPEELEYVHRMSE